MATVRKNYSQKEFFTKFLKLTLVKNESSQNATSYDVRKIGF